MSNKDLWLSGLTMGLCGKGVAEISGSDTFARGYLLGAELRNKRPAREPVAWLYNGVRLPELPEWDREKYPYAFIWASGWTEPNDYITMYKLTVVDKPLRYGTVNGRLGVYIEAGASAMWNCPKTDGEFKAWEFHSEIVSDAPAGGLHPFWTNHDVISDTDGSIYYATSDPVPVYE